VAVLLYMYHFEAVSIGMSVILYYLSLDWLLYFLIGVGHLLTHRSLWF